MKIDNIQPQTNFRGNLVYITTKGEKIANIEEILTTIDKNDLQQIRDIILKKPYDLFVSKSNEVKGFFEINANTNFENAQKSRDNVTLILGTKLERFYRSSVEAMHKYEKSEGYLNSGSRQNVFKSLFKNLFRKNA